MIKRSTYELQAMFQLFKDTRDRVIERGHHPRGFFEHMNELIIESVKNDLWKYNTPTLMMAMQRLNSIITGEPEETNGQPLFAKMPDFIVIVNAFCRDKPIDAVTGLLDEALAQVEGSILVEHSGSQHPRGVV